MSLVMQKEVGGGGGVKSMVAMSGGVGHLKARVIEDVLCAALLGIVESFADSVLLSVGCLPLQLFCCLS